jgi:hypothetical protein
MTTRYEKCRGDRCVQIDMIIIITIYDPKEERGTEQVNILQR